MSGNLFLPLRNEPFSARVQLPRSKSIANRAMVLDALFNNLRDHKFYGQAQDVQDLRAILSDHNCERTLNAGNGGTTFRFALSYLALRCEHPLKLIGGKQLSRRPVEPLCAAWRELGVDLALRKHEDHWHAFLKPVSNPPTKSSLSVDNSVSSQFASSLALIAPALPRGLTIGLVDSSSSQSYLQLTDKILNASGIKSMLNTKTWHVPPISPSQYKALPSIEKDWSAAVFFLCSLLLRPNSSLLLPGLRPSAIQGDENILSHLQILGLQWTETFEGLSLEMAPVKTAPLELNINLKSTPDHAPALVLTMALLNRKARIGGLENLKYKESNRLAALCELLDKMQVTFDASSDSLRLKSFPKFWPQKVKVDPRRDHRLAMAASLLSTAMEVEIKDPKCVRKSFPAYWTEFAKLCAPSSAD